MREDTEEILRVIRSIRPGRVRCYRDIARAAGIPRGARQVARILHSMSEKQGLPWHRVVKASGFIALERGAGFELQQALLREEGVEVSPTGWIDLEKYGI